MLVKKLHKIVELSNEIKALFVTLNLSSDNSQQLESAANLLQQRDIEIRDFFTVYDEEEIAQHPKALEQFLSSDRELQQIACDVKDKMSKHIIQQKRNVKATKAYKNI